MENVFEGGGHFTGAATGMVQGAGLMPLSDEGSVECLRPFRFSGTWLYDLYKNWGSMGEIAVSHAPENLAEVIESTQRSGEPIVLTRHGRPVAVLLEHAAFERLVAAADEASDRAALAQAREDDDSVPWEQVKVDLGLV